MSSTQRIEYLDLAKGFCILLVVLYHITFAYRVEMPCSAFFKAIRLPLYFFLSGCFFKAYGGFGDFLRRKTNKLLIPFIAWFVLLSVLLPYLYTILGIRIFYVSDIPLFYNVLQLYRQETFLTASIWFLLCLFEVNILFYIIHIIADRMRERLQLIAIISLSCLCGLCGLLLSYLRVNIPFFLDSALSAMPFFAFGYLCFRQTELLQPCRYDRLIPIAVLLLGLFLFFCAGTFTLRTNSIRGLCNYLAFYPCGFAGALLVVLLSKWIKRIPVIRWWGRYSIIILVTHDCIYKHVQYGLIHFHLAAPSGWTAALINLAITMAICSLCIPLAKRFLPHVTAQKDLIPNR